MTTNFKVLDGTRQVDLEDLLVGVDQFSSSGTLWTWGYNGYGQLLSGNSTQTSSPAQVAGGGTNWKYIRAGYNHVFAIKEDGNLWGWGENTNGILGDGTTTHRSSPVQTVAGGNNWKQISAGIYHTAAIKTDGTLWLWGQNPFGGLGDGTTIHRSSPVQTVAGGTDWKQVFAAHYFTLAIKNDGTLWTWGYNTHGGLGDGTTTHRSSPVQTVAGGTDWKTIAGRFYHSMAIKTDGTLWLWGRNEDGQLGTNNRTYYSSPVQTVTGGTTWKKIDGGDDFSAAIKTDGTLWTWGDNEYGQLGDNTVTDRLTPAQTVTGGTNWKQVSCGQFHMGGLKTNGTLWMWGAGANGQIGTGALTNRSSPTQVGVVGEWKSIEVGGASFVTATK